MKTYNIKTDLELILLKEILRLNKKIEKIKKTVDVENYNNKYGYWKRLYDLTKNK